MGPWSEPTHAFLGEAKLLVSARSKTLQSPDRFRKVHVMG